MRADPGGGGIRAGGPAQDADAACSRAHDRHVILEPNRRRRTRAFRAVVGLAFVALAVGVAASGWTPPALSIASATPTPAGASTGPTGQVAEATATPEPTLPPPSIAPTPGPDGCIPPPTDLEPATIVSHGSRTEKLVALTFDDGPTPEGVALTTAALRQTGAHATFFLIGGAIQGNEPLVRQLLAEGHEVGNHSYSHERMIFHSRGWYEDEVMRTDGLLRAAGVPAPTLFRPPYGKKLIGLPDALARHNYRMIMWDVEDPPGATTARAYADAVLRQARPGSIILMHVMYRTNRIAREALPLVLRGLRERGLRVVTVGELLRRRG